MKFIKLFIVFTFISLLNSQLANAALIMTIERISDTEGLLTASGDIDIDVSNSIDGMGFTARIGSGSSPITVISQDLMLGDDAFRAIRLRNPTQMLLRMQGSYEKGDIFSGQLHFSIASGVLREVGFITSIFNNDLPGESYGTVEYIAPRSIPEPGMVSLIVLAFGSLLFARRRVIKSAC